MMCSSLIRAGRGLRVWLAVGLFAGAAAALRAEPAGKSFLVFDNMHYKGMPDLTPLGFIPNAVIYEQKKTWIPLIQAHQMLDETMFKNLVRSNIVGRPGPVVIDIEYSYLSRNKTTTDADVRFNFKLFITLAHWAHEAAPGHLVGYYGHGLFPEEPGKEYAAETREFLKSIDAFFPSMYVHGTQTPEQWRQKLELLLQQARQIAPEKPVYPYLWGQYHEGGPHALEFVSGEYEKFQLENCVKYGCDGVVYWSGGKPPWTPATRELPWFKTVTDFLAAKPRCTGAAQWDVPKAGPDGKRPAYENE